MQISFRGRPENDCGIFFPGLCNGRETAFFLDTGNAREQDFILSEKLANELDLPIESTGNLKLVRAKEIDLGSIRAEDVVGLVLPYLSEGEINIGVKFIRDSNVLIDYPNRALEFRPGGSLHDGANLIIKEAIGERYIHAEFDILHKGDEKGRHLFLIDTGADINMSAPSFFKEIGVETYGIGVEHFEYPNFGMIEKDMVAATGFLDIALGGFRRDIQQFLIANFPPLGFPKAGIVGHNYLSQAVVEMDFVSNKIVLQ